MENISIQLDSDFAIDHSRKMPNRYNSAGISGSPLITLIENTIFTWRLAGVIYEASTDWGIILARPADYPSPNGKIIRK